MYGKFVEERLSFVHKDVEMGRKVALSINTHTHDIFPPHVLKMIQVGEDAGAMDDMLSEIGSMTDAEVQDRVLKLTATLEPVITVVMGDFLTIGIMGGQQLASIGKIINTEMNYLQLPGAAANSVILLLITIFVIIVMTKFIDIRKEL